MRANLAQLQGKALPACLRPAKTHPKPLLVDKLIEGSEVEREKEREKKSNPFCPFVSGSKACFKRHVKKGHERDKIWGKKGDRMRGPLVETTGEKVLDNAHANRIRSRLGQRERET